MLCYDIKGHFSFVLNSPHKDICYILNFQILLKVMEINYAQTILTLPKFRTLAKFFSNPYICRNGQNLF